MKSLEYIFCLIIIFLSTIALGDTHVGDSLKVQCNFDGVEQMREITVLEDHTADRGYYWVKTRITSLPQGTPSDFYGAQKVESLKTDEFILNLMKNCPAADQVSLSVKSVKSGENVTLNGCDYTWTEQGTSPDGSPWALTQTYTYATGLPLNWPILTRSGLSKFQCRLIEFSH